MPDAYVIDSAEFTAYAPVAWARALAGLAADLSATAVVAAGTDRGSELMAHLAAITAAPLAANCVSAAWEADGGCRLVRYRWAGSLFEDATLDAPVALLTVATDAVAAQAPEAVGSPARPEASATPVPEASASPWTPPCMLSSRCQKTVTSWFVPPSRPATPWASRWPPRGW